MHMTDSLGRSWQLGHRASSTTTCPSASTCTYTGADNAEHRPVMIHRALMGSYERFIGILLEHFGGELPVWLAPVQAIVLPIADRHLEYARGGARRGCATPACGPSSTTAPSRSGARSATPSCARSPTCWSSATASRRRDEVASASTAAGDAGVGAGRRRSPQRAAPSESKIALDAMIRRYTRVALIQLLTHTRPGAA